MYTGNILMNLLIQGLRFGLFDFRLTFVDILDQFIASETEMIWFFVTTVIKAADILFR